jgi:hypothetical protein
MSDLANSCENAHWLGATKIARQECGWKDGVSKTARQNENHVQQKTQPTHLTPTGLLMEGVLANLSLPFAFFGANR